MKYWIWCIRLMMIAFWLLPMDLWSETSAYLPNPNSGSDNVKRVLISDETAFESVDLSGSSNGAYGAAVSLDGDDLVVTRRDDDTVTIIPTDNFSIPAVQDNVLLDSGDEPRGVAIESRGIYAYVAKYGDDTVDEIAISSGIVTNTYSVGDGPWGVAARYDTVAATTKVYISNYNEVPGTVSVISGSGVETISDVGSGPLGVALTPDGKYLYVANYNDDQVAVIDTDDHSIDATINVGDGPWGVAVADDGAFVFVTNHLDDTVSVINTSTQSVSGTYSVGDQPMGVAAPVNGSFAYVVNNGDTYLSKITTSGTVTTIGSGEFDGAYGLGAFFGDGPPEAPADLEVTTDGTAVTLNWSDNSTDELGFKIERREDAEDTYRQIDKVGQNETEFIDHGLDEATTYHYRVRAYKEASDSEYSASASATTGDEKFSWCFIQLLMH